MAKVDLLSKEWCNIVFEGRNKAYGAYEMRRNHARHLLLSFLCVAVLVAVLLGVPLLVMGIHDSIEERAAMESVANMSRLSPMEMLRQQHLQAVATAVRPRMRVQKNSVSFVPTIDPSAGEDIDIGTDELADLEHEASTQTVQVPDTLQQYENSTDPVETGEPLSPVRVVEEMPQFPGGLGALMRWLEQNMRYPAYCVQKKIEGEVQVSFIVDKKGNVLEPKVVQPVHPFLDNEALRCVRHMPKWTPGHVDGKVSLVRVTIPIVFQTE